MEATTSASVSSSAASSVDGRGSSGGDYLNLGMFGGQQNGANDLLLGAGGFGSSLGNGFGNDAANAANSSNAGTPSKSSAFDLSDFPSLGNSSNGGAVAGSGNGLAAALRQQQQLLVHQQQMLQGQQSSAQKYRLAMSSGANGGANFNMATEDFPALPGAPPPSASNSGNNGSGPSASSMLLGGAATSASSSVGGTGFATGSNSVSRASSGGNVGGLYGNELESGGSQLDGGLLGSNGMGVLGGLGGLQQPTTNSNSSLSRTQSSSVPAPGTVGGSSSGIGTGSAAGTALSGDYGLLGLLGVIRMTDADRNSLALGSDLTMLGLSLGSSEQIYNTFSSPWSESVATKEPHYQLPMCYYMQPPLLKTGHLSKFQLETLFYIFYALSKDVLQAYAAQELYTREWRYHGDLKLWFKRAGPADGVTNASSGVAQYLYFDITSWERRIFNGSMNQNITSGFLSEDDVRVKFSNS